MAKTVVGLFDDRVAAKTAVRELLGEGFTRDDIGLMAKRLDEEPRDVEVEYVEEDGHEQIEDMAKGAGKGAAIGGAAGLLLSLSALAIPGIGPVLAGGTLAALIAGAGVGATAGGLISGLTRLGLNDDDAGTYAEGLRRGGTLVSVNAPDGRADLAVSILKRQGAIEIDKRAAEWRNEGWSGFDRQAATAAATPRPVADLPAERGEVTAEHERVAARAAGVAPEAGAARDEFTVPSAEEVIPVVEEELQVGKREVERGGVRVQKRVTETPVEEEVRLREEHVNVERFDTDYTFHGHESEAFKESLIEIKEAYEELVVNKKARVVEEVVINKETEEHTETVRETLRRTDVEVEPLEPGRARGASASGADATEPRDEPGRDPGIL
ncbi:MAG TPA: YsnF/AvaK domain-containing protein [Pyrinomonadaceae bacterium]|nr:YsnF/AvaK domain-containing protein [Pyrinomonadaceae bacterium]